MTLSENGGAQPPPLRAGVAKSDITTEDGSRRINDRLFAKALVFDDGKICVAIVTMDAVAIGGICDIGDDFLPKLRGRIERNLGIPGPHVLVNASHTHPPGRILCDDEKLLDRTYDAVRRAANSLIDVRIGSGNAQEDRIIMNRNLRLKNGRHGTIRHTNPSPSDEDVEGVGPIDPEIGILRIDRADGSPFAAVYNFGCHLLFGDTEGNITANFPGVASRVIEECWDSDAMAFFLQGAAGDIIDVQFKDFGRNRDIEPFGLKLGLNILKALRQIPTTHGKLNVISERVEFPRRTDIPARVERLQTEQAQLLASLRFTSLNFKSFLQLHLNHSLNPDFPAGDSYSYLQAASVGRHDLTGMDEFNRRNISKYLGNIRAMERLATIQDELATFARHKAINQASDSDTIFAEIQGIRIGDYVLISAPIEVLTEVGLNIKKASPHRHTFVAAFSNGYMHYGPRADAYDKGGYEVVECFLAPEWQEIFERKAYDILRRI